MNQKLRTARSSIVILLITILCIVCLSLSLALSAHFAAFADGEDDVISELNVKDSNGNDLWIVHYMDSKGNPMLDADNNPVTGVLSHGTDSDGNPILYLSVTGDKVVKGTLEDVNCFVPFRGEDIYYSITLNPDYEIDGQPLSVLYDLEADIYGGSRNVVGAKNYSSPFTTTVDALSLTEGGKALKLSKDWMIVTLCNMVDVPENYISSTRDYAAKDGIDLLRPVMGEIVVYEVRKAGSTEANEIIAVKFDDSSETVSYFHAGLNGVSYDVNLEDSFDENIVAIANGENYGNLVNYTIRNLSVGSYTLKVAALSPSERDTEYKAGDIYYATSIETIDFEVVAKEISDENFDEIFDGVPQDQLPSSVAYTGDASWLPNISLSIGGVKLVQNMDYFLQESSVDVGTISVSVVAMGENVLGSYTFSKPIMITPAVNEWETLPNINPWSYGSFDAQINKIVAMPTYLENLNDITFRIVAISTDRENEVVETIIAGLDDIHFIEVENNGTIQYTVSDDVAKLLAELHVGEYRLCVSVYGVNVGDNISDPELKRNYQPISEKGIDFSIVQGVNSWDSENGVPSIVSWTAGKYDPEKNIITAVDKFGNNAIVIIKNGNGDIVYSTSPIHANESFSDISVLKKFKAGYYTLQAQIKATDDYGGLDTLIDFEIARNGLPAWAVIIIVAGALGIVALVFGLLHQKGVLQMLTGKVIISMRTRANVDATLAAIRAAKIAREAEASIAAAKAREAEEAAKSNKDENK